VADEIAPRKKDFPSESAREIAISQEAFRMRGEGKGYPEIAKALGLKKGWTEAYKMVARAYGDAAAGQDKERMRLQEAGRLMYMRALLEDRVKAGDEKAIELDLKYTAMIVDIQGLKDGVVSGGEAGTAVQINIAPPWIKQHDGPAPDVVEGEAVEEEPLGGVVS